MTKSPILWGAGLACALGGAVAGNAVGSTPMLDRPTIGSYYQTHESAQNSSARELLPDHYPLETRDGTVPVAELSDRGLYRQARYRALVHAADYGPAEVAVADYQPDDRLARYEGADESVRIGDPGAGAPHAEPAEPLQLAAGPAEVATEGKAKLIDVRATLALR